MILKSSVPITLLLLPYLVTAQNAAVESEVSWQPQDSRVTVSLRGLSAVDENVVWVSGNYVAFARTTDGGRSWLPSTVAGTDSLDFRDVHAVDANVAYLMSAGPGPNSRIYKTRDAGKTWKLQFTNPHPEGFFNGLAFWDVEHGIAVGDPVDDRLFIIITEDGGASWTRVSAEALPATRDGEYGFAASGTGVALHGSSRVWIATGGAAARVFRSTDRGRTWAVAPTPIISGEPSAGIFSVAFRDSANGIVVGSDYRRPRQAEASVARTSDGGQTWALIAEMHNLPYRSCVAYARHADRPVLVAVGASGSDISFDDGFTWSRIDTVGYHTLSFVGSSFAGWAAGPQGRIAYFTSDFAE